jgi:hypothetical protein
MSIIPTEYHQRTIIYPIEYYNILNQSNAYKAPWISFRKGYVNTSHEAREDYLGQDSKAYDYGRTIKVIGG